MTTTDLWADDVLADMNGPLGYWGPVQASASGGSRVLARTAPRHDADCAALDRLAETLNGRTWTGTASLMDAAFTETSVATRPLVLAAA